MTPQTETETISWDGGRAAGLLSFFKRLLRDNNRLCYCRGSRLNVKGSLPCAGGQKKASQPGGLVGSKTAVKGTCCTTLASPRLASGSSSPGWGEIPTAQWGQLSDVICRDEAEEMSPSLAQGSQLLV